MTIKDKLIAKIKSLLALASDSSTSEHERALALKNAQKLMAQYSIDFLNLDSKGIEDKIISKELSYKPTGILKSDVIYKYIVNRIADNFGVYVYFKMGSISEALYLYGFETNCEIADYAINSLFTQGWYDYRVNTSFKSAGTCINFWNGFFQGLLRKFNKNELDTNALILYDKVKDEFMKKVKLRQSSNPGGSTSGGFSQGYSSAMNASIKPALKGQNKGNLLK